MFKKFVLFTIVTLIFTACDSGSSASPQTEPADNQPAENQITEKQPSSERNDYYSDLVSEGASCTLVVDSDSSFGMLIENPWVIMRVMTVVSSAQTEIEYESHYNGAVTAEQIWSICEENRKEAQTKNAVVTCEDNLITIKEIVDPEVSFEQALESARRVCSQMTNGNV